MHSGQKCYGLPVYLALWAAALFCLSGGCGFRGVDPPPSRGAAAGQADKVRRLGQELAALQGGSAQAALALADRAVAESLHLAQTYRVEPPARLHNFLVRLGLKERGLCCHWTQDLLRALKAVDQQQFGFYWAVSSLGTRREHSSIVIVAAGDEFTAGIVLDPWRDSGDLYWAPVLSDSYKWQPHPLYTQTSILRCADDLD